MAASHVYMKTGVDDDPGYDETGSTSEKSLLSQLPGASELGLVHLLHRREPDVHQTRIQASEQQQPDEALEWEEAPGGAQQDAQQLPGHRTFRLAQRSAGPDLDQ